MSTTTKSKPKSNATRRRNPAGPRTRVRPRRRPGGQPPTPMSFSERLARQQQAKAAKKIRRQIKGKYRTLRKLVLDLLPKKEVEELAWECGYYVREPKELKAFEFAVCCALAAVVEGKRGFAGVWRLLGATAKIKVARSAVTQRFGKGSAKLLEGLWEKIVQRVNSKECSEILGKLDEFKKILAHDGSVLRLSPLLQKLFPATRTNTMKAAGKIHGTADVRERRFVRVVFTGERESELAVARAMPIEPNVLYLVDLGYTSYDYYSDIKNGSGHLVARLKVNANPTIVKVRYGVYAPARTVRDGLGLNSDKVRFIKGKKAFDLDAHFKTRNGSCELRVVGVYNEERQAYHIYVTTLPPEDYSPQDVAEIYRLRWQIELLFKLLKSSCHVDHIDTKNPDAIRTHIYASLLAASVLSALCNAAAKTHGIKEENISSLVTGIAAPIIAIPLLLLWLETELTQDSLADLILTVIAIGCRDQNTKRTRESRRRLRKT